MAGKYLRCPWRARSWALFGALCLIIDLAVIVPLAVVLPSSHSGNKDFQALESFKIAKVHQTDLCQAFQVDTEEGTAVTVGTFSSDPPLVIAPVSLNQTDTVIERQSNLVYTLSLRTGSTLNLSVCLNKDSTTTSNSTLNFFLFNNSDDYYDWDLAVQLGTEGNGSEAESDSFYGFTTSCPTWDQLNVVINVTNDYYFVFRNSNNSESTNFSFQFSVQKLEYDIESNNKQIDSCVASPSCSASVNFHTTDSVYIQGPDIPIDQTVNVKWKCQTRVSLFAIVASGFFAVAVLPCFISAVYIHLKRETVPRKATSFNQFHDEGENKRRISDPGPDDELPRSISSLAPPIPLTDRRESTMDAPLGSVSMSSSGVRSLPPSGPPPEKERRGSGVDPSSLNVTDLGTTPASLLPEPSSLERSESWAEK